MTTLTKEEMEQLEKECPMVDIGFDPEEIDGRGIIEEDETEEIVEEEA